MTWSIQSDDHLLIPHERIAANVMGALAPGGIILMHDRLGHTDSNDKLDRTATLMAVDAILTQARPLMSFQTLPELEASATPAFDFQPLLASSKARAELRILLARYYPAP